MGSANRRAELLRAAAAVFSRSNYRVARISDVAAEAGVSEPLVYRHFESKKALFIELLERVGSRIVEIWQEEIADSADAVEALERVGRVYVRNLATHPAEARLQFQALAEVSDPDIAAALRRNHQGYLEVFESLLERGKQEGCVRPEVDSTSAAWILNGMGVTFTVRDLLALSSAPLAENEQLIAATIGWLTGSPERSNR